MTSWFYVIIFKTNFNLNLKVQYNQNDGKCGVCGDNWADPQPRENEAGGTYGKGVIVANYTKGQVSSTLN